MKELPLKRSHMLTMPKHNFVVGFLTLWILILIFIEPAYSTLDLGGWFDSPSSKLVQDNILHSVRDGFYQNEIKSKSENYRNYLSEFKKNQDQYLQRSEFKIINQFQKNIDNLFKSDNKLTKYEKLLASDNIVKELYEAAGKILEYISSQGDGFKDKLIETMAVAALMDTINKYESGHFHGYTIDDWRSSKIREISKQLSNLPSKEGMEVRSNITAGETKYERLRTAIELKQIVNENKETNNIKKIVKKFKEKFPLNSFGSEEARKVYADFLEWLNSEPESDMSSIELYIKEQIELSKPEEQILSGDLGIEIRQLKDALNLDVVQLRKAVIESSSKYRDRAKIAEIAGFVNGKKNFLIQHAISESMKNDKLLIPIGETRNNKVVDFLQSRILNVLDLSSSVLSVAFSLVFAAADLNNKKLVFKLYDDEIFKRKPALGLFASKYLDEMEQLTHLLTGIYNYYGDSSAWLSYELGRQFGADLDIIFENLLTKYNAVIQTGSHAMAISYNFYDKTFLFFDPNCGCYGYYGEDSAKRALHRFFAERELKYQIERDSDGMFVFDVVYIPLEIAKKIMTEKFIVDARGNVQSVESFLAEKLARAIVAIKERHQKVANQRRFSLRRNFNIRRPVL